MKVTRLRWYRGPGYPTAAEIREQPELLERRPTRWVGTGAASVAEDLEREAAGEEGVGHSP